MQLNRSIYFLTILSLLIVSLLMVLPNNSTSQLVLDKENVEDFTNLEGGCVWRNGTLPGYLFKPIEYCMYI